MHSCSLQNNKGEEGGAEAAAETSYGESVHHSKTAVSISSGKGYYDSAS